MLSSKKPLTNLSGIEPLRLVRYPSPPYLKCLSLGVSPSVYTARGVATIEGGDTHANVVIYTNWQNGKTTLVILSILLYRVLLSI